MGKWLVRGGSILALVGFFLPSVLVSCSVPGTGGFLNSDTSYSLADLANESFIKQGILFVIPVLLLVSLIFSFLPLSGDTPGSRWNASLLGQAAGFLASIGTLVISLLDLSRQALARRGRRVIVEQPARLADVRVRMQLVARATARAMANMTAESHWRRHVRRHWRRWH